MSVTFIEWLQTKNEQAGSDPNAPVVPLGHIPGSNPKAPTGNTAPASNTPAEPDPDVEFKKTLEPAMTRLMSKLKQASLSDQQKKSFLTNIITALGPIFDLSGTQVVNSVKKGMQQQQTAPQPPQQQ